MKLLPVAEIKKSIVSIKGRGVKLDQDIHVTAVSALAHHAEHGDITLMNALINAMPKSGRKNALVAWALFHGAAVMNTEKETRAEAVLMHLKGTDKRMDVDAAMSNPFWDFKAQEGTPTWSASTYLASLQKSLTTAFDKAAGDDVAQAKIKAALEAITA